MKVCYFGTYSVADGYPRNRIIIKGLQSAGISVKECHVTLWKDSADKVERLHKLCGALINFLRIIWAQIKLVGKFLRTGDYDVIIVGSIGHFDIFTAKMLNYASRKPIIFDVFISLYDTIVHDRAIVSKGVIKKTLLRFLDRTACRLADIILLDTNAHIEYFHREFKIPREKFRRVFVGADDDVFYPREITSNKEFIVLFFGTFIPLHGIENIVEAAKLLENDYDIKFVIIGKGQEEEKIKRLAENLNTCNIEFISGFFPEKRIAEYIGMADICLGIFGGTGKANAVIPCKVYNCISMKKPVITGKTSAITELLEDGKDVIISPLTDPKALADKIILLKKDISLCNSIAESGYRKYMENASISVIGKTMKRYLNEIIVK